MRHFIIELTYTVPFEQLGDAVLEHRTFLAAGYEKGWVLYSGPQLPKIGGVIIARAPSLEDVQLFMLGDPFLRRGLATYHYIEFDAVRYQPFMQEWVTGQE